VKKSEIAAIVPPTPAEWAKMADAHLRALRLAYVIANDSLFALASGPAKPRAYVAVAPGHAAEFHRALAELCEKAEQRFLDASFIVRKKSPTPQKKRAAPE
jgi:hypothetical protein